MIDLPGCTVPDAVDSEGRVACRVGNCAPLQFFDTPGACDSCVRGLQGASSLPSTPERREGSVTRTEAQLWIGDEAAPGRCFAGKEEQVPEEQEVEEWQSGEEEQGPGEVKQEDAAEEVESSREFTLGAAGLAAQVATDHGAKARAPPLANSVLV